MSRLYSISEICDRALRKIGAFAIRSSGARPEEIEEARYWLDMTVGHQSSRMRTWWMVPGSGTFNLTSGTAEYDLAASLGQAQAPTGVQFVIAVYLYNTTTGTDIHEIPIVRRQEWEHRQIGGLPDDSDRSPFLWGTDGALPAIEPGQPKACYIDRQQAPTIHLSPTPDDVTPYGLRVVFQSYATDFTKEPPNDKTYKLRTAWNLWVVTALAAQIGNGPVRKLPQDEVKDMRSEATRLRDELEAYENMEHANEPRRVAYHNF